MSEFQLAKRAGWITPIATAIVAYRHTGRVAKSVRSIDPIAAGAIFTLAYVAGLAGSVAVLLVAVAFLAGLYLATRVVEVETMATTSAPMSANAGPAAAVPSVDGITAFGLPVSEIKFKQPAAARAKKVAAA